MKTHIIRNILCLFFAVIFCLFSVIGCNEFPDEQEDEQNTGKTYDIGNLKSFPAAEAETNPEVDAWILKCRENTVNSVSIFCLTSYDENSTKSVYLFYLPKVKTKMAVDTKIVTKDYKTYDAFVDFVSSDEPTEEDIVFYMQLEVIRPSLLQKNVSLNGKSGVMLVTQAKNDIDLSAFVTQGTN